MDKSKRINLNVSTATHELWNRVAHENYQSLSNWMRSVIGHAAQAHQAGKSAVPENLEDVRAWRIEQHVRRLKRGVSTLLEVEEELAREELATKSEPEQERYIDQWIAEAGNQG